MNVWVVSGLTTYDNGSACIGVSLTIEGAQALAVAYANRHGRSVRWDKQNDESQLIGYVTDGAQYMADNAFLLQRFTVDAPAIEDGAT